MVSKLKWWEPNTAVREAMKDVIDTNDDGEAFFDNGDAGAAKTIDYRNGSVQRIRLTASNPTLTITHMPAGRYGRLRLLIKQDGTGSRTNPTYSPAAAYGTTGAPTLTTTANKTDIVDLFSVDGGTTLLAVLVAKGF